MTALQSARLFESRCGHVHLSPPQPHWVAAAHMTLLIYPILFPASQKFSDARFWSTILTPLPPTHFPDSFLPPLLSPVGLAAQH